jgi:long-chain fatty acid transport protein
MTSRTRLPQRAVVAGVALFGLLAFGDAQRVEAAGLYLAEFGTADMGTAGAGALVRAADAATAVSNPAGMTYLDDHQLQLGAAPGIGVVKFDRSSNQPPGGSGGDGGNQGGFVPLMSTSYVHKISDRLRLGLGLISITGASLNPNSSWAGRNEVQQLDLLGLTFIPTLGLRVTDWLSLGAGPAITYATLDWKLAGPGGGRVKIKDLDDVEAAALVSAMLRPLPELRFGLVYQSKSDLKLKGKIRARARPALDGSKTKVGLPLAQAVRGDVWWDATEKISLTVGAAWEDWSELNQTSLSLKGTGPLNAKFKGTAKIGMKDTWKLRGGVHYKWDEAWTLTTGVSYDSSPLEKKKRTAALPFDEQIRFSVGAIHQLSDALQLSTAFQWTHLGDARIDNANLKGKYAQNEIFFLMFNLNFKTLPWSGKATF